MDKWWRGPINHLTRLVPELVLHASQKLQERFETLLDKRKAGTLSPEEEHEYAAIGDLDTALSWLNRLSRSARHR